jgi:hypothetical protein
VRLFLAIAVVAALLAGVAGPHHHAASGGAHECASCTVGGALEAREATPALPAPPPARVAIAAEPAPDPVTGFPLGAVAGQSPPRA